MSQVGELLEGRYELEAQLGTGGTAVVFRARDLVTKAKLAIKVMDPGREQDPEAVAYFHQEGRLAARIRDPHLVSALHFGIDEGRHFIVYDYLPGSAPLSELAELGRVEPRRVCDIALQVLSALDTIHRAGVVHGDVSLNNCLWREREGHRDEVRLIDLGCAWARLPSSAVTGGPKTASDSRGTAYYTAPEILSDEPGDHRADLWSVGAMMYALLTTREVDLGEPDDPLKVPPPALLVPTIPQGISDVVMRGLAPVDERFPTAAAMAEAIRAAMADRPVHRGVPLWASVGGMVLAAGLATLGSLASMANAPRDNADVDVAPIAEPPNTPAPRALEAPGVATLAAGDPARTPEATSPLADELITVAASDERSDVPRSQFGGEPSASVRPPKPARPLTWVLVESKVRKKAAELRPCSSEGFISLGLRVADGRATVETVDSSPVSLPRDRCAVDVVAKVRFANRDEIRGVVGVALPEGAK